jgi:hypothetical protein
MATVAAAVAAAVISVHTERSVFCFVLFSYELHVAAKRAAQASHSVVCAVHRKSPGRTCKGQCVFSTHSVMCIRLL